MLPCLTDLGYTLYSYSKLTHITLMHYLIRPVYDVVIVPRKAREACHRISISSGTYR